MDQTEPQPPRAPQPPDAEEQAERIAKFVAELRRSEAFGWFVTHWEKGRDQALEQAVNLSLSAEDRDMHARRYSILCEITGDQAKGRPSFLDRCEAKARTVLNPPEAQSA